MTEVPKKELLAKLILAYVKEDYSTVLLILMGLGIAKMILDESDKKDVDPILAEGFPFSAVRRIDDMSESPEKQQELSKLANACLKKGWTGLIFDHVIVKMASGSVKDKVCAEMVDALISEGFLCSCIKYIDAMSEGFQREAALTKVALAYAERGWTLLVFNKILTKMAFGATKDRACEELIELFIAKGDQGSVVKLIDAMSEGAKKRELLVKLAALYIKKGWDELVLQHIIFRMPSGIEKDQACEEVIRALVRKKRLPSVNLIDSISESPEKQDLLEKLVPLYIKEGWSGLVFDHVIAKMTSGPQRDKACLEAGFWYSVSWGFWWNRLTETVFPVS